MAKYLVLIYGDEQKWEARTPEEENANHTGHRSFTSTAGPRIVGGEELEASSTATTLRRRSSGDITATDGPFLETKEVLGGYYVLEAEDLDEVIALVRHLPELSTSHGAVEIRPVVDHSTSMP
ncbi:MAG: YciI family protein [Cellulomonas sp.]